MPSVLNPITDIYHTQLEASRRLADVVFSGSERIDHVVIEATHHAFTEQVKIAHAAMSMRDPKELANMQSSLIVHRSDSAVNLQKEMVRMFAEIQNEMGKSFKETIEKLSGGFTRGSSASAKNGTEKAGDTIFNPLTGMFAIWDSVFREMAALATKNMNTARSSYEHLAEEVSQATMGVAEQGAQAVSKAGHNVSIQSAELAREIKSESRARGSVTGATGGNGSSVSKEGAHAAEASVAEAVEVSEVAEERRPASGAPGASGSRRK